MIPVTKRAFKSLVGYHMSGHTAVSLLVWSTRPDHMPVLGTRVLAVKKQRVTRLGHTAVSLPM